mgnify:CR=1 FL=1
MANPLLITDGDISGVLKNIYASFRINAFPKLTPLLAQLKKGKAGGPERMQWGGNGVFFDVILDRPVGMVANDAGLFPPGANARERQATLGIKRTYVQRQIDALAVQGTSAKEAAFVPLARKIVTEALDAARLGQQEVLHGDGSGVKALLTSTADTTHFVAISPYGITGAGQGGLLLDVGMFITVHSGVTSTIRGSATITNVANSGDNCTVTLDTAIASMASGDGVYAASTAASDSRNAYPNGLTNIINRGAAYNSFEGIDAATFGRWDSTRFVAGTDTDVADAPSEMDVWKLATTVAGKSGKDARMQPEEFLLMTTPGIERRLAESFLGQRRWDSEAGAKLEGGFKSINIAGLNLISDYWCPQGTLYLLHIPSLTWVDRQDWVKLQYEDSGPWRFMPGRDAYEVNFGAYWNDGALQRNSHGVITGYTDPDRFTHVQ